MRLFDPISRSGADEERLCDDDARVAECARNRTFLRPGEQLHGMRREEESEDNPRDDGHCSRELAPGGIMQLEDSEDGGLRGTSRRGCVVDTVQPEPGAEETRESEEQVLREDGHVGT